MVAATKHHQVDQCYPYYACAPPLPLCSVCVFVTVTHKLGAEDEQRTGRYTCISSETEQEKKAAQPQLAMWLLRPATYETFTI